MVPSVARGALLVGHGRRPCMRRRYQRGRGRLGAARAAQTIRRLEVRSNRGGSELLSIAALQVCRRLALILNPAPPDRPASWPDRSRRRAATPTSDSFSALCHGCVLAATPPARRVRLQRASGASTPFSYGPCHSSIGRVKLHVSRFPFFSAPPCGAPVRRLTSKYITLVMICAIPLLDAIECSYPFVLSAPASPALTVTG